MREIKFRVYIKMENKIKEVCTIDFDEGTIGVLEINLMGHPYIKLWNFGQVVLMQYSGLKDVNGVEICEGNIYKDEENMLWEAIYDEGRFQLENIHIPGRKPIDHYLDLVGNMFENPELMEI